MSAARRSSRRAGIVLAALLLGLVVYAQAPQPAPPRPPALGVHAHLMWQGVSRGDMDRQLDAVAAAGARIVRVDVGWASVEEQGKGRWNAYHLRRLDAVVTKARARRLQVLPTVFGTPCWASSAPESLRQGCAGDWSDRGVEDYAPRRPADYADALAFLVRRYGRRVPAWELWNEPNSRRFFAAADPAHAYVALVKAAYRAIKEVDERVQVVAGSLMHADVAFTERLYRLGIKGAFDAFSIHPYSEDRSPLDPGSERYRQLSFVRGVPAVREAMLRHADRVPLWLTEFGWNTSRTRGAEAWRNGVDEATQAHYLGQALQLLRAWPYVDVAVVYGLRDMGTDPDDYLDNFGLLRHDGAPKRALGTFRNAATDDDRDR
jgi:polysaccharide biosynthesis protein PslG